MLITGEIYQLINFASFSRWFFIALATLGMLVHRFRFPHHPRPFKVNALSFCFSWLAKISLCRLKCFPTNFPSKRCPWLFQSPSLWFASSLWASHFTRTPGTQDEAVPSLWPGCRFTMWPSIAFSCPAGGGTFSVSCANKKSVRDLQWGETMAPQILAFKTCSFWLNAK